MRSSDWSSDVCSSDLVPKKGRSHAAPEAAQQDTLASIDYSKIVTREIQRELKEQATAPKSAVAAALEVPTAAPRARERRQAVVLPSHRTFKDRKSTRLNSSH